MDLVHEPYNDCKDGLLAAKMAGRAEIRDVMIKTKNKVATKSFGIMRTG